MCTLTHFTPPINRTFAVHSRQSRRPESNPEPHSPPRFQVVPAGNAFFHIKEISTGHVRGFRSDHNEACALARSLE